MLEAAREVPAIEYARLVILLLLILVAFLVLRSMPTSWPPAGPRDGTPSEPTLVSG